MTPVGEASTAKHLEYVTERCAQVAVEIATIEELIRARLRRVIAVQPGTEEPDPVFNALQTAITLMREKYSELARLRRGLGGEPKNP
jgi:hypothetical protein